MKACNVVVVELPSRSDPTRAKANALGLQSMLRQEGLPFSTEALDSMRSPRPSDLLLIAGSPDLPAAEARLLAAVLRCSRFVWIGEAPTSGALAGTLGLSGCKSEGVANTLYAMEIEQCPDGWTQLLAHERRLKIKYCPVLIGPPGGGKGFEEIASIRLWDGMRLGPGVLISKGAPRSVVVPVALGWAFAFNVSHHHHTRYDLDMMDSPLQVHSDLVRNLVRDALVWAAAPDFLLRPYYWPVTGEQIPAGAFCLNHDCCGFSPQGLRFIRQVCRREKIRTTFFDYPGSGKATADFRLTRANSKEHDVALHIEDRSSFQSIQRAKQALEELQGRPVRGWRRHGPTLPESYPRVWRHVERAGIKWTACWGVNGGPWMLLSEGTTTGNRLPFHVMDVNKAQEMDLLELPSFESQDAERLSSFFYGQRWSWEEFTGAVRTRFEHAARHNLMTGYLIHVWTAGVKQEKRHQYGARDAQRMMEWVIRYAKRHRFCILGHEELYDWWSYRGSIRICAAGDSANVALPAGDHAVALEVLSHGGEVRSVRVDGRRVRTKRLPVRGSRLFIVEAAQCDRLLPVEVR